MSLVATIASGPHDSRLMRTDEELFAAYRDGEANAFDELYSRYASKISGFIARRICDADKADELTQDTFLRIHRARASFDTNRRFSTWAYTIASNLVKNEHRRRSNHPERPFSNYMYNSGATPAFLHVVDRKEMPDEEFERRELRAAISATFARLSPHHLDPLIMKETGHSFEEIAVSFGIPVNTAKSRVIRARGMFRSLFTFFDGDGR